MQIQFNTDKNVTRSEDLIASSTSLISEELSKFSHQITRVEAVSDYANTHELAFSGAIDNLKTSLDKTTGRLKNY